MQQIPLSVIPSQQFTITLDSNRYDITIKDVDDNMVIDITRNGIDIIQGSRVLAQQLVIPYRSLESSYGNFIFTTSNDEIPYWTQFGVSVGMFYLSAEELAVIRG